MLHTYSLSAQENEVEFPRISISRERSCVASRVGS